MFHFQISDYDDTCLDAETEELLRRRLEARSRKAAPGLWKVADRLNAAAQGPGRKKRRGRYRAYGVILLALGIFALIPGLAEPGTPALILAGGLAVLAGTLNLLPARDKKPRTVPASCKKEAQALLAGRRVIDWSKTRAEVHFDESGMTARLGEARETVPYGQITGVFETEHLWLLVYDGEKALLLQKKDLTSGEADAFSAQILQRVRAGE